MVSNRANNVTVVPMAVGAANGQVQMMTNAFACDNHVTYDEPADDQNSRRIQVPIVSLDEWCQDTGR